jgi:hypothetical protein
MDFDMNVNHYTDQEIKDLLDLNELNYDDVVTATQTLIDEEQNNPEIVNFYMDIRQRFENKDNTTKTINAEVKKGTINPDLKNTLTRMINVDSSYRVISNNTIYDTDDYLFTLSEPINNVISLMLYSIEIPQSWYTFSLSKGTTIFQPILMAQNDTETIKYEYNPLIINDGNYTTKALLQMVMEVLFNSCGIFSNQIPTTLPPTLSTDVFTIEQHPYTGRCKIIFKPLFNIANIILPDGTLFSANYTSCKIGFVFHSVDMGTKINYNLGWLLGFRLPFVVVPHLFTLETRTGNIIEYSSSIIDTAGTKYIILKLDDYQSNRLNKSLVWINPKIDPVVGLPSYYNKSLSQYQTTDTTINVLANAPRQLTAKQLYTINSISNSKIENINIQRVVPPDDSDILAKIPLKRATEWGVIGVDGKYAAIDSGPSKLIVEFSGPLQLNTREYFGPVTIRSFSITLYDDKGMVLGMNGVDWSFTLMAKSIYQY